MKTPRPNGYRDAWAGELTAARADQPARVAGWVHRRRDHGGLIFIDLRDRSGIVQLTFHPDRAPEAHALAHSLRSEHVVTATGTLVRREEANVNPNLPTGEVELLVDELTVHAAADTPPFPIDEDGYVDETLRLRHRALDLRRTGMQETLKLRHTVTATMRGVLNERDFLEIETPSLTRSTPEGARDYLVPARIDPGSFYALPQSPQLFKQLLMVGGFERYYQIARCFRDEDTRADRQPEFTQLDLELSFVDEDDVIETMEAVMGAIFAATDFEVAAPAWPRMSYAEAMLRFGSDRPDTRFGLEIAELGEIFAGTEFKVFAGALSGGGVIRGLNAGARELPRRELDILTELARQNGAKGLVWAFVQEDGTWRSPVAKALSAAEIQSVNEALEATPGDLLLVVADSARIAAQSLGALRLDLAERFSLVPEGRHDILWVVDFPMFEQTDDGWTAMHHPFTAPTGDLDGDPGAIMSRAYDLVLDGSEIGGGSIRINTIDVQRKIFGIIGFSEEEAQSRFGFLLDAFRYGAPPHGGIAMGVDRIVTLLAGRDSIRDAIAFPKAASGSDPLTGAPAPVDDAQLREVGLRVSVFRAPPAAQPQG
ncbi:aspartate--tRNA ligase [Conexibacter sp. JD483]|uniref:aspartate--tRNA ligase n=1 Tax=unclassified Conexibacter TaxID=2627773 RepID=UPI002725A259|nr:MULTISPECIES: aspartate--tRNA ligase [unclassified Conexibacter]MDO8185037.1 aspartate--tRNA ligase [Conexibacter sp. CPCC 205706]MDO8196747.1 aspartate--tRNA ligase [Conexibacter sp. CPCC 205762]MDR9367995.1 aspartate--tRNA ligase [Conexibacter sp. JD483]